MKLEPNPTEKVPSLGNNHSQFSQHSTATPSDLIAHETLSVPLVVKAEECSNVLKKKSHNNKKREVKESSKGGQLLYDQ